MGVTPKLGPVVMGTLLTRDIGATVAAYEKYLYATVQRRGNVSAAQAKFWGQARLEGNAYVMLTNALGEPFLRIIEDLKCEVRDNLKHTGWMALEIVVEDVDALAASLKDSPFEVLRPVADLSMSDKIRAVQVRGPCGEILYLTQIKGDVPPFELPAAKCKVDKVFIPVLCTHDRAASLAFYENISSNTGLSFDTKITVVNQAYGIDLDTNHPVATLQLKGATLIEIDEIKAASEGGLSSGIMMVTFAVEKLPAGQGPTKDCPNGKQKSLILTGVAGEYVELVETL